MKGSFDTALMESGALMRRGSLLLIENIGKVIAAMSALIASLVIFTEITFADLSSENVTSTLAVILVCSYIIYFSLLDTGERAGKTTKEYKEREEEYGKIRSKIKGEDIPALRAFCIQYAKDELEYRRNNYLFSHALDGESYEAFLLGKDFSKKETKILKRAKSMQAVKLNPKQLLSMEKTDGHGELHSPERTKLLRFLVKLIPSTVCTIFTVSIALNLKDGLSAEAVLEGILKLTPLPMCAFKGYTGGYTYAIGPLSAWQKAKTDMLDAFLEQKCKQKIA